MLELADELEAKDDEITETQLHVHLNGGGAVQVDQTGKFKALPADEPTKPFASREPISETPARVKAARSFLEIYGPTGRVVVTVAILLLIGFAIWHGVKIPWLSP